MSFNVVNELLTIVAKQLSSDLVNIDTSSISMAAKWVPREDKALYADVSSVLRKFGHDSLASEIMKRFPTEHKALAPGKTKERYRKMLSKLTKKLDVVETHMTGGTWAWIDFSHVPSVALKNYTDAFTMEDVSVRNGTRKSTKPRRIPESKSDDRVRCKDNYVEFLTNSTKVNGAQVAIEKLVEETRKLCKKFSKLGSLENMLANGHFKAALYERQFDAYVLNILEQLKAAEAETAKKLKESGVVEKFTFSVKETKYQLDVSGSMEGTPMNAAIALGLVFLALQKLEDPDAPQTFLTFDTRPAVVNLDDCESFYDKVSTVQRAPWGGSTNFIAAFDEIMKESGRNIKNAPKKLVVMSDMQFDEALGHEYTDYRRSVSSTNTVDRWETMYDTICTKWKAWYGLENDDDLPTIVFWNLRANLTGSPVDSSTRGVIQISGYSASLLKMLLFGDELVLTSETREKPNPSDVLKRALHASEYDCVRTQLGWTDGVLAESTVFAQEVSNFLKSEQRISVATEVVSENGLSSSDSRW
jgi:hypothetical protein